jgi:xanthine dehydrogenase accessory factor
LVAGLRAAADGRACAWRSGLAQPDANVADALRRGDFGYFGLIGSRTKRTRFARRLEQRGIDPAAIARMTCPIGVEGVTGKGPEVLAVAVVAQLLQRAGAAAGG